MSRHLEALAAIAAGSIDATALASDESLLILQQTLRLRDAHICRVEEPGGRRRVQRCDGRGTHRLCTLPEPRWQQSLSKVETEAGWVAGFVICNPPGQAVLHLVFDHQPEPDDLTTGAVAATLLGRLLPRGGDSAEPGDPVTGLPGRAVLERHLLDGFTAADRSVSVILADVNGLKAINDQFGHRAGDRLLRRVGGIIADVAGRLGPNSVAARIGGDEFAIAATGLSEQEAEVAIASIDVAASKLGDGTGLARGYARLTGDAPGSPSPAVAVHGILALADAQLYEHKAALPGRKRPSKAPSKAANAVDLIARLEGDLDSEASVETRLARVAGLIAEEANAAAWWLSRQVGDAVVDVACRKTRERPLRWDEPERPVVLEPKAYRLDDFRETRLALSGAKFEATLTDGAESERALLAYFGYRSVIGAGGTDDMDSGWLIEIYGDYLTEDLPAWSDTLLEAIDLALRPRTEPTKAPAGELHDASSASRQPL